MKGGENVADYEKVFEDNHEFIYKYLMKLCNNSSLAEELTQETFFRAYMNYNQLRNESKAPIWLCQIAKNLYYAWYNENKKISSWEEVKCVDSTDIFEAFVINELSTEAFAKLHELEEPYKEVFMLSVFANISLKEISKLFGKSESWARVTFYRARKKLLDKLR